MNKSISESAKAMDMLQSVKCREKLYAWLYMWYHCAIIVVCNVHSYGYCSIHGLIIC